MKKLRDLMGYVIHGTVPAEFANQVVDTEQALRDEMKKLSGNFNLFRRNQLDLFELLQESIDEVVPNKVINIMGMFAEVKTFKQGDKVSFKIKRGKNRAKQYVTRVAPNGLFETFRLDQAEMLLEPEAHGGAAIIDFERYLDGEEDLMDLYDIIVEGLTEEVFKMVQATLISSWEAAGRPANTCRTVNAFDATVMEELCQVVSAYGSPVIYCPPQFAATMSNAITYTPVAGANITSSQTRVYPEQDLIDIREQGYIGKFRSYPIVVLPQSFEDDTNEKWVINPRLAYVLPSGKEKLVKVAFEGDTIVDEYKNRDRSMEIQAYKKFAVGIIASPNNWGIYQNAGIAADDTTWAILA